MRLKNKIAIITGGASGMGAADARVFAAEGASLVIADVLDKEGDALATDLSRTGAKVLYRRLDVTDEAGWDRLAAEILAKFGAWDILVNNAGLTGAGVSDVMDLQTFDRLMEVNLRGAFLGIRAAVPHMKARGGSIINMSSICGLTGAPGVHFAYHASKGALRAMTKAAAAEFGAYGIRVNSVHPGIFPPMRTADGSATLGVGSRLLPRIPMGRVGDVAEVARTVLFLASDESSYVTGAELLVDGGFLSN